jgi:hypothetical protein
MVGAQFGVSLSFVNQRRVSPNITSIGKIGTFNCMDICIKLIERTWSLVKTLLLFLLQEDVQKWLESKNIEIQALLQLHFVLSSMKIVLC